MTGTTVGRILRSSQSFCGQICEKQTLDYGIAYYSERFALVPEANQFREVVVEDRAQADAAYAQAEDWFESRGLSCFRWSPAGGQATPELTHCLEERGFRAENRPVLTLTEWVEIPAQQGVRVLPARALRGAYRATFLSATQPAARRERLAEAYGERLDDPQYDAFVALVDQEPVGRGTLYQVGDFARVMDLLVLPGPSSRFVAEALLAQTLAMAKRLAMRSICVELGPAHVAWQSLLAEVGFVADGAVTEFLRDAPSAPGPDR